MPPPSQLTFLCVATEWSSSRGGLSTFNRELCASLVAEQQRVFCLVPSANAIDKAAARSRGVELVAPRPIPGLDEIALLCTLVGELANEHVDVVVGHGRITGPSAIAQAHHLKCRRYVHFLHMAASRIDWHKPWSGAAAATVAERMQLEVELGTDAELVVAVGPELQRTYSVYFHGRRKRVDAYLPGLTMPANWSDPVPPGTRCLLFGRAEDARLKGVRLAADALRHLTNRTDLDPRTVEFAVRGAAASTADALQSDLQERAGPAARINVAPYTVDTALLTEEIRGSSLVLMPSLEEGFGLTGLEAISEGVPVLLSHTSGLAQALESVLPHDAMHHVVDVNNKGPDHLAQRMFQLLSDRESAFSRVRRLREAMRTAFSWSSSTQQLLQLLNSKSSSPPPASGPKTPPLDDLQQIFREASAEVEHFPRTIGPAQYWMERPELEQLLNGLPATGEPSAAFALLGPAGSGKSALLSKLSQLLSEQGIPVLAIKADSLPRTVNSLSDLQEHLRIPLGIDDLLQSTSRLARVALLVDQLDALSETLDLQTARLSVLLDLIARTLQLPNVLIVASCRTFDFRYDARFRLIDFREMNLELPPTASVLEVLASAGYNKEAISASPVEFLRTPQYLRTFLSIAGATTDATILDPYQRMLATLWRTRVTNAENGAELERTACALAERMAASEELWLDPLSIDLPHIHLQHLVSSDILAFGAADGSRVGFAHQTLFSFALARSFAQKPTSLSSFVLDREQSLFVRPILWIVLPHMRAMNSKAYHEQLTLLWQSPHLRRHLQSLMIRFIGSVDTPSPQETTLMLRALSDVEWSAQVLDSTSGRTSWLNAIEDAFLVPVLQSNPSAALGFLAKASAYDLPRCNKLVQKEWLPDHSKQRFVATWLWQCAQWNEDTVAIAEAFLSRDDTPTHISALILKSALDLIPHSTPQLLLTTFVRIKRTHGSREDVASRSAWNRPTDELLREVNRIDCISDCAASAPREFMHFIWPWFASILEDSANEWDAKHGYKPDYNLETELFDASPDSGIASAAAEAVKALAAHDGDWLDTFVHATKESESVSIHRYLIIGLIHGLPSSASIAFQYLLEDARRLLVGDEPSSNEYSKDLVQALSPHLSPAQHAALEKLIFASRAVASGVDLQWRRIAATSNRLHRHTLLLAMGRDRLSSKGRSAIDAGSDLFAPEILQRRRQNRRAMAHFIGSPVSAAQMQQSRDEHILNLFKKLPDHTGTTHPERPRQGGSVQASQAFADFAKIEPLRAARLLARFEPGVSERPVAYALDPLAATLALPELEELIAKLVQQGFSTHEFRRSAAYALERKADRNAEMTPGTLQLLQSWLQPNPDPEDSWAPRDAWKGSIVWGERSFGILPDGNYPVLSALTTGLLVRKEPEGDQWLRVLEQHVQRRENPRTWGALASHLSWAFRIDALRGARLVDRIFLDYPAVLLCADGVRLVATAMHYVDAPQVWSWMTRLRDHHGLWASQAFGELLVILATRPEQPAPAVELLEGIMGSLDSPSLGDDEAATALGVAYAAAHLWHEDDRRASSTRILLKIVTLEKPGLCAAAMMMFNQDDVIPWDEATRRILRALVDHPIAMVTEHSHLLFEDLAHFAKADPEMIAKLCLNYVRSARRYERTDQIHQSGEHLVRLSIALQRLGPASQALGLTLFEELLSFGALGTSEILEELDLRPAAQGVRRSRSRTRYRRRR